MTAAFLLLAAPAAADMQVSAPFDTSLRDMTGSPDPFDFGPWPVHHNSTVQTFTFTCTFASCGSESNTLIVGNPTVSGFDPADFTVLAPQSGDCQDGAAVRSCTVRVRFNPLSVGNKFTFLHVVDDDCFEGCTTDNTVQLAGQGQLPTVSPSSLAFGNQGVGTTSASQTVTIKNDSNGTFLKLGSSTTGDFARTTDCPSNAQLAPSESCHVFVTFTPTATGSRSGNLTISTDSGNTTVPLSGNGTVHLAHAPASLAFGNQLTNTQSATPNVTFTNDSGGPVTPGAATITGADAGQFAIASNGCTAAIAPGANCVIGMRFQPAASGAKSASLSLASDSTGSPDVIAMSGTGTTQSGSSSVSGPGPGISFDVSTIDFGARIIKGGALTETLKLTNNGDQPLVVTTITIAGPNAGDFSFPAATRATTSACADKTLQPGTTCNVQVNFLPGAAGDRTASLLIADNAPGSPQTVGLQGSGLPPPVLYRTANAEPVSGEVTVALPPTAGARAGIFKGRRFIPLREARQVPMGTIFNTKKGRVRIATATLTRAKAQAGSFFAGLFQVLQRRSQKSLTEAKMVGSNFKSCRRPTGKNRARIAKKKKINKKVIRTLRANVKGKFRTRGRFAAATVRGTIWSMRDRCDGTLTKVTRGTVVVRDLRARRNIVVRTGKSAFVPKR